MEVSARLSLPMLISGQLDKDSFHNEALQLIDFVVAACVEAVGVNAPPASPQAGQCWIVGSSPSGGFTGHANCLAGYGSGGWRFIAPVEGLRAVERSSGLTANFQGGGWTVGTVQASQVKVAGTKVVGAQQPSINNASGGVIVDVEARAAINALLAAVRAHGLIA